VLILTVGFFILPALSYACGTKTEKSCCKKEFTSKTEKKDCCCKKHKKENDNSCGGKCGHSNCTNTTTVSLNFISLNEIEFKNNNFDFSTQNQNFNNPKTHISSGFSSLWLIPKIG
jgi:hypothetical protein